jgi:hypothetical protein
MMNRLPLRILLGAYSLSLFRPAFAEKQLGPEDDAYYLKHAQFEKTPTESATPSDTSEDPKSQQLKKDDEEFQILLNYYNAGQTLAAFVGGMTSMFVIYYSISKRAEYLRLHSGREMSKELEAASKVINGKMARLQKMMDRVGLSASVAGKTITFSLKKVQPFGSELAQIEREMGILETESNQREAELDGLEAQLAAAQVEARRQQVLQYDEELAIFRKAEKILLRTPVSKTDERKLKNALAELRKALAVNKRELAHIEKAFANAMGYMSGNSGWIIASWKQVPIFKQAMSDIRKRRTQLTKLRIMSACGAKSLNGQIATLELEMQAALETQRTNLLREFTTLKGAYDTAAEEIIERMNDISPTYKNVLALQAQTAADLAKLEEQLREDYLTLDIPFNEEKREVSELNDAREAIKNARDISKLEFHEKMEDLLRKAIELLGRRLNDNTWLRSEYFSDDSKKAKSVRKALTKLAKVIDANFGTTLIEETIVAGNERLSEVNLAVRFMRFISGLEPVEASLNSGVLKFLTERSRNRDRLPDAQFLLFNRFIAPTLNDAKLLDRETDYAEQNERLLQQVKEDLKANEEQALAKNPYSLMNFGEHEVSAREALDDSQAELGLTLDPTIMNGHELNGHSTNGHTNGVVTNGHNGSNGYNNGQITNGFDLKLDEINSHEKQLDSRLTFDVAVMDAELNARTATKAMNNYAAIYFHARAAAKRHGCGFALGLESAARVNGKTLSN